MRRESSDEVGGETNKSVSLDELIQIDTKKLHCDAEMIPEVEVLGHFDNVVLLVCILHKNQHI